MDRTEGNPVAFEELSEHSSDMVGGVMGGVVFHFDFVRRSR